MFHAEKHVKCEENIKDLAFVDKRVPFKAAVVV